MVVRPPSPKASDRRRLSTLLKERIQHTNRIDGMCDHPSISCLLRLLADAALSRLQAIRQRTPILGGRIPQRPPGRELP
jgi:hypothetical protein